MALLEKQVKAAEKWNYFTDSSRWLSHFQCALAKWFSADSQCSGMFGKRFETWKTSEDLSENEHFPLSENSTRKSQYYSFAESLESSKKF